MATSFDFKKGFNDGYILRKNHPLLIKKFIDKFKTRSQYLDGLQAGCKQYEMEVSVKMNRFNNDRLKGRGHNLEL